MVEIIDDGMQKKDKGMQGEETRIYYLLYKLLQRKILIAKWNRNELLEELEEKVDFLAYRLAGSRVA